MNETTFTILGICIILFVLYALLRVDHIGQVRLRLIDAIYGNTDDYDLWQKKKKVLDKYSYSKMIFMVHKWSYISFYPETINWK